MGCSFGMVVVFEYGRCDMWVVGKKGNVEVCGVLCGRGREAKYVADASGRALRARWSVLRCLSISHVHSTISDRTPRQYHNSVGAPLARTEMRFRAFDNVSP